MNNMEELIKNNEKRIQAGIDEILAQLEVLAQAINDLKE